MWDISTPQNECVLFSIGTNDQYEWINWNPHHWHFEGPMKTTAACICPRQDLSSALSSFFSPDDDNKLRDATALTIDIHPCVITKMAR